MLFAPLAIYAKKWSCLKNCQYTVHVKTDHEDKQPNEKKKNALSKDKKITLDCKTG